MKINRDPSKGHHYLNDLNVVVNTRDGGIGDSLGRTARAMIVYDEDRMDLLDGLDGYVIGGDTSPEAGRQLYITRYPEGREYAVIGNSRDHVVIYFSCLKQIGEGGHVAWMISNIAKRPCIDHPYTLGQKIWFKALFSRFWSIVYMMYKLLGLAVIYPVWNFMLRLISGTLRTYEHPHDKWLWMKFDAPNKWQKFCYSIQLPVYASFYTLYEITALDSQFAKRILRKVMILHFEKSNYVARALCGQDVSYPEGYMPSRANRWSVRLDRTCDRNMMPYHDTEENNLELAMLKHYCK